MGKILEFPDNFREGGLDGLSYEDLTAMSRPQLEGVLAAFLEELAGLDSREPKNEDCEEFLDWADAHEELEDWIDDVRDLLS